MEGRGEERRVVRAHGKKRKEVETDVTSFWYFQHCGYVVT
jgi:hypothetical protein